MHWYSLFISLLPQTICYEKLPLLLPQYSLSHLLRRAANTKIPEKPFPVACQYENRQYFSFLHCLLHPSRKHIYPIAWFLVLSGEKLPFLWVQCYSLILPSSCTSPQPTLMAVSSSYSEEKKNNQLYLLPNPSLRHQDSGY